MCLETKSVLADLVGFELELLMRREVVILSCGAKQDLLKAIWHIKWFILHGFIGFVPFLLITHDAAGT